MNKQTNLQLCAGANCFTMWACGLTEIQWFCDTHGLYLCPHLQPENFGRRPQPAALLKALANEPPPAEPIHDKEPA